MLRRSRTRVVCVGMVAAAAATVPLIASANARTDARTAGSRRPRIYVANKGCRGHAFRPENITLACGDGNLYATEVHFFLARSTPQAYGRPEADASATIHENTCTPDCASGKFLSEKGALILKRIVRCRDGLLYYSRAEYAFPAGQGTASIAPRERCAIVRALQAH